jgi:hypothetical protein
MLRDDARHRVGASARREAHHEPDRTLGISLRVQVCRPRERSESGKEKRAGKRGPSLFSVHAGSGVDCQATICQPFVFFTQTLV